ncbi:hypothetical protein [Vibrio sp. WXL103]|uniref:hypothetical protein n=1 Tax=Vibrio sp. WXL103 TaxID=3450710 RepID=UPI003EC8FEC9
MKYPVTYTLLSSALLYSAPMLAEDFNRNEVDPADLTKVSSSAIVGMSNKGDVKFQGSVAGDYASGNGFMLAAEANMNKDGDYTNSRLQYFHSSNTGYSWMPKAAGSLDIIDNDQLTSVALGGISLINSPWSNVMFFPQLAYVYGHLDDSLTSSYSGSSSQMHGAMAAFYTSIRLDSNGSFISFWPEYTTLRGDYDITTTKYVINSGTPLSDSRDKWLMVKIENSHTDVVDPDDNRVSDKDTIAWFNFRMFF